MNINRSNKSAQLPVFIRSQIDLPINITQCSKIITTKIGGIFFLFEKNICDSNFRVDNRRNKIFS